MFVCVPFVYRPSSVLNPQRNQLERVFATHPPRAPFAPKTAIASLSKPKTIHTENVTEPPCGSSKWLRAIFTLLPTNGNDGEDRPAGMRTRFGCENENAFRRLVWQECSCSDLYEFGLDGSKQGSHDQAGEDDTR